MRLERERQEPNLTGPQWLLHTGIRILYQVIKKMILTREFHELVFITSFLARMEAGRPVRWLLQSLGKT